ncbi:hypothetical protein ACFVVU_36165 [Kitasatospora sp. NPDC057965]|uniref:hypothetical protein n=1 Tax=Kitasatospora sp. NPDC057965 TaxID=3346291 RepID=UPI0036DC5DAB
MKPLSTPAELRQAVVSHLGAHAVREQLPAHLRSCRCRVSGCPWHLHSRSCAGRIVLVLFQRQGRMWYLADACEGCARAIAGAAAVHFVGRFPLPAPPPSQRVCWRGGEARTGEQQRLAARAALGYTAVSLHPSVGAEVRLLAVVCTLRVRPSGLSPLPGGLVRALRLEEPAAALRELRESGWLYESQGHDGSPSVLLPKLVGCPRRMRAGHWALRALSDRRVSR